MDHASDKAAILPHGTIHGEPKAIDPEAKAPFQIGAWYDGNARFDKHMCV
jgi:hypothetical protein